MPEISLPRILIVDDEVAQMKALCETLKYHSYETTGVSTGEAALIALREQRFDLILTDLMMPETNGIAVLRTALEIDPDLVGVIMTGEGTIATAVEAMKTGALDYILKPFKVSMILPVLARALAVRRLRIENAELTEHLRQRTTELEAANKDLEAFSYSVSHDLRAPLRGISGFSTILLEDHASTLSAEGREVLTTAISSARRMGQLIDDLLRFSKLGRQPLSKRRVSVSTMIRDVLEELRGSQTDQPDRHVEVLIGDLPDCVGDPALLKQVFINLLSNALKFTRYRERALIEIGCEVQPPAEQSGPQAKPLTNPKPAQTQNVYFVRDNGAGFDMNQAGGRLFGVFKRLHGENEFEGTGVGLSMVHRIIDKHGGRVWANAEVDKGATFYFVLG
jgi:two-component system sensor histidine kinase/response regulator